MSGIMLKWSDAGFKRSAAESLFISPADKNYTYARFFRGMSDIAESFWQALQALEKYYKAGLLLNGVDTRQRRFGHNLFELHKEHVRVFGNVAVRELIKPERLDESLWRKNPLNRLLETIMSMGHPDTRYALLSTFATGPDIFLLDALVWELRRRCVCLEWVVGEDLVAAGRLEAHVGQRMSEVLITNPNYQHIVMKVNATKFSRIGESFAGCLYGWNLPFGDQDIDFDKPAPVSLAGAFGGAYNSFIYMLFNAAENIEEADREIAIRRLSWVKNNIKLPNGVSILFDKRIGQIENGVLKWPDGL